MKASSVLSCPLSSTCARESQAGGPLVLLEYKLYTYRLMSQPFSQSDRETGAAFMAEVLSDRVDGGPCRAFMVFISR
jgi:hypothetical protein